MPLKAAKATHRHLKVTPFDTDGLTTEQGIGYLLPCRCKHPLKGGAGDVHLLSTLFLFQSFQVFEAYRLSLIYREANLVQES